MPRRSFSEPRWLQKLTDAEFRKKVFDVSQQIWAKREVVPYPDVVRARILMLALSPDEGTVEKASEFATALGVKKNCLWNYFTRDVAGWVDRMERRLGKKVEVVPSAAWRLILTQDDLSWMVEFLKNCPARSWTERVKHIQRAAATDPDFRHLSSLPRTTLMGRLPQLKEMAQFVRRNEGKGGRRKAWATGAANRERWTLPPESPEEYAGSDTVVFSEDAFPKPDPFEGF